MGEDLKQCKCPLRRVFKRPEVHACDGVLHSNKKERKRKFVLMGKAMSSEEKQVTEWKGMLPFVFKRSR